MHASRARQISLDVVLPGVCDVPALLDHPQRRPRKPPSDSSCGPGKSTVVLKFCWRGTHGVNEAVDVVGQAGKPRTISGFQTHQTPVRLGTTERGELATEEYIPYSHVLEGFVILQKNPGYEKEDAMQL